VPPSVTPSASVIRIIQRHIRGGTEEAEIQQCRRAQKPRVSWEMSKRKCGQQIGNRKSCQGGVMQERAVSLWLAPSCQHYTLTGLRDLRTPVPEEETPRSWAWDLAPVDLVVDKGRRARTWNHLLAMTVCDRGRLFRRSIRSVELSPTSPSQYEGGEQRPYCLFTNSRWTINKLKPTWF